MPKEEAVPHSSFGGLIGVVLALGGSLWISAVLHMPFVFNGRIVLVAFLFSAMVGVSFTIEMLTDEDDFRLLAEQLKCDI